MRIPLYIQETPWTCGPASIRMALGAFGIAESEETIAKIMKTTRKRGTDHKYFPLMAEKYKLNYLVLRNSTIKKLSELLEDGWIVILNYYDAKEKTGHYAIALKIKGKDLFLHDPWHKKDRERIISLEKLKSIWYDGEGERGWLFAIKE